MFGEPPRIIEGKLELAYAAVAALTWMTWDAVINLSVEVECIWRRPTSWVKFVYGFVRYIPILHGGAILTLTGNNTFSPFACQAWITEQLIVIEILTLTVEAVLVMRLYILYNHNKIMLCLILTAFAAEVIVMITALAFVIGHQGFTPDCLVARSPRIYIAFWLSSLAFETFLFALTLFKFFQHVHEARREESVIYVFVRDGTWAFALLFVSLLLNTLMYQLIDTPVLGMGYFWDLSCLSFAGSHILLNLRRLAIGHNDSEATVLPTLNFAAATNGTERNNIETLAEGSLTVGHGEFLDLAAPVVAKSPGDSDSTMIPLNVIV